jgi:hypothetical protein
MWLEELGESNILVALSEFEPATFQHSSTVPQLTTSKGYSKLILNERRIYKGCEI